MTNISKTDILIAQPNISDLRNNIQIEVANSPAFQCLDENFHHGKITATELAMFKLKYAQLYDKLTRSRDNEYNLLQLSKKFNSVIDLQNSQLVKSSQFPNNVNTVVSRTRMDVLKSNNTLMAIDESIEKLNYQIYLLRNEKKLLQRQYSNMPKHELDNIGDEDIIEVMIRRTKTLNIEISELSIEIDKVKRERNRIAESLRVSLEFESDTKDRKTQCLLDLEKVKNDLFITTQLPAQYSKEYEKLRKQKTDIEKETHQIVDNITESKFVIDALKHRYSDLDKEISNIKSKDLKIQRDIIEMNSHIDDIDKMLAKYHDEEMMMRMKKASLEYHNKRLIIFKKNLHTNIVENVKVKDNLLRNLKNAEMFLEMSQDKMLTVKKLHDKANLDYRIFPKNDMTYFDLKLKIIDDISNQNAALDDEVIKGTVVVSKIHQTVTDNDRRLGQFNNYRSECVELVKLAQTIAERRELAANDFLCAERRYKKVKEEITIKNQIILEQQKILQFLQSHALHVARMYSLIKMERNKCVALLQLTNQTHLERKEKLKLRTNEFSIIYIDQFQSHSDLLQVDKDIKKVTKERDNLRGDICRLQGVNIERIHKRDIMRLNIQRLNSMFNKLESDIIQTKKLTEKNVVFRNERAMHLIERNEDTFILEERIKLQDSRSRDAQTELQSLEEQVCSLKRYKTDLVNHIQLLRKRLPVNKETKQDSQSLLEELAEARDKCCKLEKCAESSQLPGRLRLLSGKDLNSQELREKVKILENRSINREERLLEKDLLLEAVIRLTDQVRIRSNRGKQSTIIVAHTVNQIKSKIKNTDSKLRIKTTELTLKMTEYNESHKQIQELNRDLNIQYDRLENNKTPTKQLKKQFQREIKHKKIKQEYHSTMHIKRKIFPNPMRNNLYLMSRSPQSKLPPIKSRKPVCQQ